MAPLNAKKVTADEFLARLVSAEAWELVHNPVEYHILELHVIENGTHECYIPTDFLEMDDLVVKVFFQRMNEFLSDPEMVKKRVKNYRELREAVE